MGLMEFNKSVGKKSSKFPQDLGVCVCTKLLNILINYLNFLIIKFCDGVKAESKKKTHVTVRKAQKLREPGIVPVTRAELTCECGEGGEIIYNRPVSGSQGTGSQHRSRGSLEKTIRLLRQMNRKVAATVSIPRSFCQCFCYRSVGTGTC